MQYERSISLSNIGCASISINKPFKTVVNITGLLDGDKKEWQYRITLANNQI